ncbi:hypothetical protein ACP4OV_026299 [Aristida adscensionis]
MRKRKGRIAASNSGLQLRRSKRLAEDSTASIDENSNPDMSDPENFARNYIPLCVRRTLSSCTEEEALQSASLNTGGRGHVRGARLCLNVWTLPEGVRIPVALDNSGEPIGKEAATLTSFLGSLARDGVLTPLVYLDWRFVPEKNKDVMWHIVKRKFDIAPICELWIMRCLGRQWKHWKAVLKQRHFDTHETEVECLADLNPRVLEEQWRFLVQYWSIEKAKAASTRNKACRANVTINHTMGSKSFARVAAEERQKRPNKDEPTPDDLFILTHTAKDVKTMKKAAADL